MPFTQSSDASIRIHAVFVLCHLSMLLPSQQTDLLYLHSQDIANLLGAFEYASTAGDHKASLPNSTRIMTVSEWQKCWWICKWTRRIAQWCWRGMSFQHWQVCLQLKELKNEFQDAGYFGAFFMTLPSSSKFTPAICLLPRCFRHWEMTLTKMCAK